MNRELTTREKTLLLVLAVLVIALGYWKLVFEPINEQVASYNDMAEQEQAEIDSSVVQLAQMRKMQKAVEAQKEAGEVRAIPSYDNSGILMRELYQILANTNEYTVDFSAATSREGYIVLRPVSLTFQTGTYEQARDHQRDRRQRQPESDLGCEHPRGTGREPQRGADLADHHLL